MRTEEQRARIRQDMRIAEAQAAMASIEERRWAEKVDLYDSRVELFEAMLNEEKETGD